MESNKNSPLAAEEDDEELGCHDAKESGEGIDRGVADGGLVVVVGERLGIRQGRRRRHRASQQSDDLEVIHP